MYYHPPRCKMASDRGTSLTLHMWWCWSSSHMALSWCDRANKAEWPILLTISCRLPGQQVRGGGGTAAAHCRLNENCPFQGFKLLWHSYDTLKCLKCRMLLPDCKGDQAGMRCFYTVGEISALWPRHVTHRQEPPGEICQRLLLKMNVFI